MDYINLIPAAGIIALIFVFLKNSWVSKKEVGSAKMEKIAKNIADGAMAFLKAEYKILSIFIKWFSNYFIIFLCSNRLLILI